MQAHWAACSLAVLISSPAWSAAPSEASPDTKAAVAKSSAATAPSERTIRLIGGDRVVSLIYSIQRVKAFRVGRVDARKAKTDACVAGRVIVGTPKPMPAEFAEKLIVALLSEDTYWNGDSKGTGRDTGIGFRAQCQDGGSVEVSFCLQKGNVFLMVRDAAGTVVKYGDCRGFRDSPRALMRLLAAEAFPDDPVVQKFKPLAQGEADTKSTPAKDATKSENKRDVNTVTMPDTNSDTPPDIKPDIQSLAAKAVPPALPSPPFASGAAVTKLADGFAFTEGPTSDADGNVYFTDQPNDRIHVWSVDGKISTFLNKSGRSNGLCFDAEGKLWACADEKNELWRIDVATKAVTVVVKDFGGKLLNGPNDVWVRPQGGVYFTDPMYKRPYWKRGPEEQDRRAVYFLSAKGELSRVEGDFQQPNGIVGSLDGKTLYVADAGGRAIWAYDIGTDGALSNRRKFCDSGSDGMTVDADGNVYLTAGRVLVFDRTGKKIAEVTLPEGPSNVCFGGREHKTLFITARKGLYSVPMSVTGGRQ